MSVDLQMTNFQTRTYENLISRPQITIEATISFRSFEQLTNIDLDVLKKNILETVRLQAVQVRKAEGENA